MQFYKFSLLFLENIISMHELSCITQNVYEKVHQKKNKKKKEKNKK